ncbi:MAG: rhodanese-like domain-containing protein [Candidatus Eiseniibacteriota bacterium]
MTDSSPTRAELAKIPRVSAADARALVEQGGAVLVDTRDRRLFDNAHATGAISIPLREVEAAPPEARQRFLPPDGKLVIYCT